jgi:hypothetical protein
MWKYYYEIPLPWNGISSILKGHVLSTVIRHCKKKTIMSILELYSQTCVLAKSHNSATAKVETIKLKWYCTFIYPKDVYNFVIVGQKAN